MKFHLGGAAMLFCCKKIGAGYNICTLLLSVTVVCGICCYSVCWTFMECIMCGFVLFMKFCSVG